MTDGWLEKAIAEAVDRGDFDDLAGAGRPIERLDRVYDPSWWAKGFVTRERARDAGVALQAEVARALPVLLATADLGEVRARVAQWNGDIARINRELDARDQIQDVDLEDVEGRWARLRR